MKYSNHLNAISEIVSKIDTANSEKYHTTKCTHYFNVLEIIFGLYIDYANNLNKLSDEYKNSSGSIRSKFSETVIKLTTDDEKKLIIDSKPFNEIKNFRPHIMDDGILQHNRYDPKNISSEIREKSSKQHKTFVESCKNRDKHFIIDKLCKLLYMIRCNLNHCGKTPRGPDLGKHERDEKICTMIFPLLEIIVDILLEYHSHKLICYGTLRTGQINEIILKDINESSTRVNIFGTIKIENELPYYEFDNLRNKIPAELINNKLLYEKFDELDNFEGKSYKRKLVPYEWNNKIFVSNIYVDNRGKS